MLPAEIGTRWLYEISSISVDTFEVVIIGEHVHPNSPTVVIWESNRQRRPWNSCDRFGCWDVLFVEETEFAVEFRMEKHDSIPFERLDLPLGAGDHWPESGWDEMAVVGFGPVKVEAGEFTDAFHLRRRRYGEQYVTTQHRWYVRQVGLIMEIEEQYDWRTRVTDTSLTELIDFQAGGRDL